MKNIGTKIPALIFIIITAAYILFKLIQTTQIYNNIRKVWRNHIACLIKCRERRKILMPFKNACLQFLYALFGL